MFNIQFNGGEDNFRITKNEIKTAIYDSVRNLYINVTVKMVFALSQLFLKLFLSEAKDEEFGCFQSSSF